MQDLHGFSKIRVKWKHLTRNHQQLTPRLTTIFAYITQAVKIQNMVPILENVVVRILENFSQWSKLDTTNQRENPTNVNFLTVNCKRRTKRPSTHSFI